MVLLLSLKLKDLSTFFHLSTISFILYKAEQHRVKNGTQINISLTITIF